MLFLRASLHRSNGEEKRNFEQTIDIELLYEGIYPLDRAKISLMFSNAVRKRKWIALYYIRYHYDLVEIFHLKLY